MPGNSAPTGRHTRHRTGRPLALSKPQLEQRTGRPHGSIMASAGILALPRCSVDRAAHGAAIVAIGKQRGPADKPPAPRPPSTVLPLRAWVRRARARSRRSGSDPRAGPAAGSSRRRAPPPRAPHRRPPWGRSPACGRPRRSRRPRCRPFSAAGLPGWTSVTTTPLTSLGQLELLPRLGRQLGEHHAELGRIALRRSRRSAPPSAPRPASGRSRPRGSSRRRRARPRRWLLAPASVSATALVRSRSLLDLLAAVAQDHVALLEAGARRRAVGRDLGDQGALRPRRGRGSWPDPRRSTWMCTPSQPRSTLPSSLQLGR